MSRYNEVYQCVWDSDDFKSLSKPQPNAQTLWFYLLTGKIRNPLPGIYNIGLGTLEDFLKWSRKSLMKCFQELLDKGMVKVDPESNIIYLPQWYKWNKPQNPNVLKGWLNLLDNIPNCDLKVQYIQQLKSLVKSLGEPFAKTFKNHFGNDYRIPEPEPVPIPKPIPEPVKDKDIPPTFFEISKEFHNKKHKQYPKRLKITDKLIEEGAETIDKLIRLDGFDIVEIKAVLDFAIEDDFWKTNLYSLSTLRNKGKNGNTKFVNILSSLDQRKSNNDKNNEKSRLKNDPLNEYNWKAYLNPPKIKDNKGHILGLRYNESYLYYSDKEILHIQKFSHFMWVRWYCPECDKCFLVKPESLPKELKERYEAIEKLIKKEVEESLGG